LDLLRTSQLGFIRTMFVSRASLSAFLLASTVSGESGLRHQEANVSTEPREPLRISSDYANADPYPNLLQRSLEGHSAGTCDIAFEPLDEATRAVLGTLTEGEALLEALDQFSANGGYGVGSITELLAEAADAEATGYAVEDGKSGNIEFPHGNLKPIATVGEMSLCEESSGQKLIGVPDGVGAYLADDDTVRVIFQSESYGPLRYESYIHEVNEGAATFSGSNLQNIDYDRSMMVDFMAGDAPASTMVKDVGNMIQTAYNLKGELVGPRVVDGKTTVGAHYSNTDAAGIYVGQSVPAETDWFYQSFCSAHMEEKHQVR